MFKHKCLHLGIDRNAKTFKILKVPLNYTETKFASEISYVFFIMCNFEKALSLNLHIHIFFQVGNFHFLLKTKSITYL